MTGRRRTATATGGPDGEQRRQETCTDARTSILNESPTPTRATWADTTSSGTGVGSNCVAPNAHFDFATTNDFEGSLYAVLPIRRGEEICISYIDCHAPRAEHDVEVVVEHAEDDLVDPRRSGQPPSSRGSNPVDDAVPQVQKSRTWSYTTE